MRPAPLVPSRSAVVPFLLAVVLSGAAFGASGTTEPSRHTAERLPETLRGALDGFDEGVDIGGSHATDVWIVHGGTYERNTRLAQALGLRHNLLPNLGMVTFLGTSDDARRFVAEGASVERRERLDLHLDRSVAYIEADVVKKWVGVVRDGPVVLVVDTGVDSAHPDFQEALVANVQPDVMGGLVVGDIAQEAVVDPAGHGTHVGGIVAGSGAAFGTGDASGRYRGVYSNGRLASYQVTLDPPGSSDPQVDTSAALQAFEWALTNRNRYDIRVVTNSWGAPGPFEPGAAVNQATLRLYLAGMTVVFSGGNEGTDGEGTLNKYCMAPWVLCVAAGDFGRARTPFSSIGRSDQPYAHPDLTAPGSRITAAHPVSSLGSNLRLGSDVSRSLYSERSGTSMSAPHVAATAGLLLAARPDLSPDQVMDILVATTDPMADSVERVGAGYLNARMAFNLAVETPGNLEAFLAGDDVKYAGRQTGDPEHERDPVSVGYLGQADIRGILPGREEALWVASSLMAWVLASLAAFSIVVGIEWRRPRRVAVTRPVPGPGRVSATTPGGRAEDRRGQAPVTFRRT